LNKPLFDSEKDWVLDTFDNIFMNNEKITPILQALNKLLDDKLSLYTIPFEFDKLSGIMKQENLKIEVNESKTFYACEELNLVHQRINEANSIDEAAKWYLREKELLAEKASTETIVLKQEPSLFEYKDGKIIGFLSKSRENERLIWNLSEGYMLNISN
jgi:hypothetical protein